MRAVQVVQHGRPSEAIAVRDVPVSDVEPGTVRVAVAVAVAFTLPFHTSYLALHERANLQTGQHKVHGALCELVSAGAIRPAIGRRIGLHDVAATLEDHDQRRTSGRSVVDLTIA